MLTFGIIRSHLHQTLKLTDYDSSHFVDVTAYKDGAVRIRGEAEDYRVAVLHVSREGIAVREEKTCEDTGATWDEELFSVAEGNLTAGDMMFQVRRRKTGMTIRLDCIWDGEKRTAFYLDVSNGEEGLPEFTFGGVSFRHLSRFLYLLLKAGKSNEAENRVSVA